MRIPIKIVVLLVAQGNVERFKNYMPIGLIHLKKREEIPRSKGGSYVKTPFEWGSLLHIELMV
jgi:hypothetical protein